MFEQPFHDSEVHGWHGEGVEGVEGVEDQVRLEQELKKSWWTSDSSWIKLSRHNAALLVSGLG